MSFDENQVHEACAHETRIPRELKDSKGDRTLFRYVQCLWGE
jgi:hypothetical protein